ncbi:DUF2255 family protein [Streptomyces sp. SD15]
MFLLKRSRLSGSQAALTARSRWCLASLPWGRIRAGGVDRDVTFVDVDGGVDDQVDAVCRAKYGRCSAHLITHARYRNQADRRGRGRQQPGGQPADASPAGAVRGVGGSEPSRSRRVSASYSGVPGSA